MAKRNEPNTTEAETLTPGEASAISGLTPTWLARLADRGELTVSKPGGTHRRYVRAEVERLAAPVEPSEADQ
ncbi:MerR family transcriptional regulator [Leucobacter ruminantium]|uniref:Helix-turn-helix domain-containing protein n=1 Tax=Leucobacter ruminantium TaxID=1289170 RepID=A0A939RZX3_9MICO|nr:helix-turn-helix domain-containing protein [Leucobacter ruminantium]MBO1805914.1 helix-turn-helix domain-containing protein [Leucobacter ruminantium]